MGRWNSKISNGWKANGVCVERMVIMVGVNAAQTTSYSVSGSNNEGKFDDLKIIN